MSDLKQQYPAYFDFFEGDEFSATTFLNKYALKDKAGNILENDPNDIIDRVMTVLADGMPESNKRPSLGWLTRVLKNEYNPALDVADYYSWKQIFIRACDKFKGVCPQGSILSAAGDYSRPQSLSNCFVIDSPHDSISGIFITGEQEAQLQKRRAGVGFDLSTLRPTDFPVSNAARTSSGVYGWMNFFSNVCRSIGQSGRRGALLLSLDIKHPDALLFAQAKRDLSYATGANVSLKISDEFMKCVENNKVFVQQFPVNSKNPLITKEVNAKELFDQIVTCAHACGDPGLLMWDNCIKNLPANVYDGFKAVSTNPCGEQILSPNDSCRLSSICLTKYVNNKFSDDCYFDYAAFERDVRIAMRLLDGVVSAEIKAVENIIDKVKTDRNSDGQSYLVELDLWTRVLECAKAGRRVGLGTHGLCDALAQLRLRYDSDDALVSVKKIYKTLRDVSYDESIEMAIDYGKFEVFDYDLELQNCEFIKRLPKQLLSKMQEYGRRNITILTNAPTGTISILSGCSSGIEPTFRHVYMRRRKINSNDLDTRVDFVDDVGDKWQHFPQFEKNVKKYFDTIGKTLPDTIKSDKDLEKYLPEYFITSDKIQWENRIKLQAIAQRYIDSSISSTINLPKDTTVDVVASIYMEAWRQGLKGITVYRDGSKSGVLVPVSETKSQAFKRVQAPKRPIKLPCEVHFTKVRGEEFVVVVGLYDGAVYEVFFGKYTNQIPHRHFSGYVEKKGKAKYLLTYIEDVDVKQIDINKYFNNDDYEAATRLISTALRHGTPLYSVIDQLQKSSPTISEYGSAISRILKKYVKVEEYQQHASCCVCESKNIEVRTESGCFTVVCKDCGNVDSKCG